MGMLAALLVLFISIWQWIIHTRGQQFKALMLTFLSAWISWTKSLCGLRWLDPHVTLLLWSNIEICVRYDRICQVMSGLFSQLLNRQIWKYKIHHFKPSCCCFVEQCNDKEGKWNGCCDISFYFSFNQSSVWFPWNVHTQIYIYNLTYVYVY